MVHCRLFRESLESCEKALKNLPEAPTWSLTRELASDDTVSRISQAEFSQPLCTALQIALVDLLQATGVQFNSVIGHSSGEIGAAYAAGILKAEDAIAIAYYRGLVAHLAEGPAGQKGGMMAAGMSFDEATTFCSQPQFNGRISIAASNAPSSVTLSGDFDAIQEAKAMLDEKQMFARLLKVDTAYHSHHMLRCADLYLTYLRQLDIKVRAPREDCIWSSSVQRDLKMEGDALDQLKGQYWLDNMVQPVLFSQALAFSLVSGESFDVALEIGPHPALKGPVSQTLKPVIDSPIPYTGCLKRGAHDLDAMSSAIGLLWSYLGPSFVRFDRWRKAFDRPVVPRMLKDLPSYAWDHDQVFWNESRLSHDYRLGAQRPHELLGRLREDCQYEMTWRNVFRLSEMPWVKGHKFQGQVLFPGAGYVSMAVEAAAVFARGRPVKTVEIQDMRISKALVIDEDSAGVETIFTIRSREGQNNCNKSLIQADFACYSSADQRVVERSCDGQLLIHVGEPSDEDLPPNPISQGELPPLDVSRFFKAIDGLGISYDGVFRTLDSIHRTWGHSKATASWGAGELRDDFALHPAVLDVAFQAGFATFASIAEKAMGSTYLPAGIRRIVIDPRQKYRNSLDETSIAIEAHLASSTSTIHEVDINLCNKLSNTSGIQVEGLILKAIAEPSASDDRLLFAKTVWEQDAANTLQAPPQREIAKGELEYIDAVERTALFFMQNLTRVIRPEELADLRWQHRSLFRAIEKFVSPVREGSHAVLKKEWLNDDREIIREFATRYPDSIDIALLTSVGEGWPSVVRGESEMLEHMLKDNLLSRLYVKGRGFALCNDYAAEYMRKISHKYPRMRILEIGAGTGGTTRSVFNAIGDAYSSYTYTDISAGFFEKAGVKFADQVHKMDFKTFNCENPPTEQGFNEGSYDVIVAANVLHATRTLSQTMEHVRLLLRPGGFLVAVEVTGTMLREPGLMGGLEGWWLGEDDGRFPCPGISANGWHDVLQKAGFSGVDSIIYDMPDVKRHNCSVFVSQAVDEQFDILSDPLLSIELVPEKPVLIVGGRTLPVSKAIRRAEKLLKRWTSRLTVCNDIDSLNPSNIDPETSVLCFAELDKAVFSETMSAKQLENLQELLGSAQNILWVTSGGEAEDPYSKMMIGIGRACSFELPHVNMQFLNFDELASLDVEMTVQYLLRMALLSSQQYLNHNMLWVQEPEVQVKDEITLVPRVVRDSEANERLNAKRREISKPIGRSEQIEILYRDSKATLVKSSPSPFSEDLVAIEVELSVALHSSHETSCFLCFGHPQGSSQPVLASSESNSSVVVVPKHSVFELPIPNTFTPEDMVAMGSAIVASEILGKAPTDGTILLYEPAHFVAEAVTEAAKLAGRRVMFITATPKKGSTGWIMIHPLAQSRAIRRLIPSDSSVLIQFSDATLDHVVSCLPKQCKVQSFDPSGIGRQQSTLVAAYKSRTAAISKEMPLVVEIAKVQDIDTSIERLSTVVDWKRTESLNVVVPPLDASKLFAANKTYFLVGMAGELGQSLCLYMINCGARHIVLASRNPIIDINWLEDMQIIGAEVRTVKMDVTDRAQVKDTVSVIRATMPEIAGVGNAALVLDDTLFVNATVANVEKQLKPKVDGTIYLDEEFANDNLDFFIAFSSLGSVYGNAGQSIYHAANMFMTSLVEKRRRRGQAGSVINIGMIVDVGYVAKSERAGTNIEEHLRSQFYMPLAETEFHHLILEAVLAGHPSSAHADVTMGIRPFIDDPEAPVRPHWYNNPCFSHMILPHTSNEGPTESGTSTQQLREQLEKAESVPKAKAIFQELFCKKIELMMRVPAASIDVNAPISDLGLDSLLAIEIRNWLLKDMHVEIPLLTILGREPMSSICLAAAEKLVGDKPVAVSDKPSEDIKLDVEPEPAELSIPTPMAELEGSGDTVPSDLILASGTITRAESPTHSESKSDEMHQDFTPSSVSSVSNFEISLPEQKEREEATEFKRVERTSFAQSSLHFLQTFLDDSTTFNVSAHYNIKGSLNAARFARALEKTMSRHEAYQTCFFVDPISQQLNQGISATINKNYFTHIHSTSREDVEPMFQAIANREWKLTSGQTFQTILITHNPESHSVLFGCHHIIMDGMSWHIFLQDLDRAYQMLPLKPVINNYTAFAHRQIEALNSGKWDKDIAYWRQELDPIPSVIPLLPFAKTKTRRSQRAYRNHIIERQVSPETVRKVKDASRICKATPMQFYLATVQTLFARLLGLEELCIGVTDTGRGDGEFNETVGHFTNLLPMRFKMAEDGSFKDLIGETSRIVLNGYDHAEVPIDVLLEKLDMGRSPEYTPLFQVAFNYRVGDLLQRRLGNCTLELVKYRDTKAPYDVTFNITETGEGGHFVEVLSSEYLYSASATEVVMDTFVRLLESLSLDPSTKLQDCSPWSKAQVDDALVLGRGPRVTHKWPETLTERFEQVRAAHSDSVAIKDNIGSMTYNQLAHRRMAIAAALVSAKAGAQSRVAVLCEPSIDTYATMLAILHIGASYVPLDMSLPAARHRAMIDTCQPELLVFHSATADAATDRLDGKDIVSLDLSKLPSSAQQTLSSFQADESFLLFTSGSTGTPKGIRLSQKGIMNYAASKSKTLGLGQVTVLQQSSTGFDMSVAQAFNAFANAGTLVIAPSKIRGDPIAIAQLMLEEKINFTLGTPSEYLMLATYAGDSLRQCTSWRNACSGGEAISELLMTELRRLDLPELALTDCYGPTEISCAATWRKMPMNDNHAEAVASSSVGQAIPNTSIYVVGGSGETLPVGFPGEICVGGCGIANGYLDTETTATKFVRNPFATSEDQTKGWNTMYKTGDKGCLREDGSLVFLGRTDGDTLVKLRGLRIELNEVANIILQAAKGSLVEAVVSIRGQPEFLVAHVVFARDQSLTDSELNTLSTNLPLPQYMIPSIIIATDRLPVTPNGKIDRKAVSKLLLPERALEADGADPLTVPEGELRLIWREILGEAGSKANIRRNTDFFTVGGSSMLLVRMQNALKERMGIELPLHELYQASTLRRMAALANNERSQLKAETIDWVAETQVPGQVLEAAQPAASPTPQIHNRQILLTGSTGFLGSEILEQLLGDDDIAKIHCVAVPADAKQKLPSSPKIVVYVGSLLSPDLGLSKSELTLLQTNVDQIIHAGAQGHCLNNYSSVRQANYLSTHFLAKMALPRRVPLHFISSARVILQSGPCETPPVSMAAHPPPADGSQGFTASKWASETFLENVASHTGLPVVIHRHCSVIGSKAPQDDAMNSIIRYSLLSQTVPDVPNAGGYFDFKDIVAVASEIARGPVASDSISFRHHSSGVRVPFSQLAQRMETLHGGKFGVVSLNDWLEMAVKLGIEDLIVSYLKANVAGGGNLTFPYLGMS